MTTLIPNTPGAAIVGHAEATACRGDRRRGGSGLGGGGSGEAQAAEAIARAEKAAKAVDFAETSADEVEAGAQAEIAAA